ncbi:hypothetical protein SBBP2_2730001 [Burkholderiales bacterium]|nr:hypothetical protein SBBP2_2730001 [Burkholderiales bacterium]
MPDLTWRAASPRPWTACGTEAVAVAGEGRSRNGLPLVSQSHAQARGAGFELDWVDLTPGQSVDLAAGVESDFVGWARPLSATPEFRRCRNRTWRISIEM